MSTMFLQNRALILIIITTLLLLIGCSEPPYCRGDIQEECIPETQYHIGTFHWNFSLPGYYVESSAFHQYYVEAQARKKRKMLERKGYDVKSNSKTLINLFGDGNFNATYQKYDHSVFGTHNDYFKQTCDGLYTVIEENIMNATLSHTVSTQIVDSLEFKKCKVMATLPDNKYRHWFIYARIFGKSELTVTIDFDNAYSGNILLNGFLNSRFRAKQQKTLTKR
ncbi:MAG: hypothetical protein OCC49_00845 [Fibrobacterales bacterium]